MSGKGLTGGRDLKMSQRIRCRIYWGWDTLEECRN